MKKYIIILAGGSGSRMNTEMNKVLLPLCGKTVIRRSMEAFSSYADEMIVVCRPQDYASVKNEIDIIPFSFPVRIEYGGKTRQESVLNGLKSINPDPKDIILIHDAARCLVSPSLIGRVIHSVILYGSGVPGIHAVSTYKIVNKDSFAVQTPDRSNLYEIQTPQGFTADTVIPLSLKAAESHLEFTDDAGILEHFHVPVKIVEGDHSNIKLTSQQDLIKAMIILEGDVFSMRVGMGFDVHQLTADRKLVLCGVEIPFELGLLGHSDADVALHALMDAMLGACALGDIGRHFPDSDMQYKDVSSMHLLKETVIILHSAGYQVHNADITIVAQKPKLLPYLSQMVDNVSDILGVNRDSINIKATTTEHLGFEGRMEGISAYSVCTVCKRNQ